MDAPESLHRQIFGRSRIADDAQNPPIHGALMLMEERLERVDLSMAKCIQDAARFVLHSPFLVQRLTPSRRPH
jgi:hypothetical protein